MTGRWLVLANHCVAKAWSAGELLAAAGAGAGEGSTFNALGSATETAWARAVAGAGAGAGTGGNSGFGEAVVAGGGAVRSAGLAGDCVVSMVVAGAGDGFDFGSGSCSRAATVTRFVSTETR